MLEHPHGKDRFHRQAITVEEARRRIIERAARVGTENIALQDAWSRRISEPLFAPHQLPHFNRSGMDGYAVKAFDIAAASNDNPIILQVVEDIPCGHVPQRRLEAGEASRIMTGAMLPEGADTVVMLEMTELLEEGKRIKLVRSLPEGRNVTPDGFEIAVGEQLIEKGTLLEEGQIALLATFGCAEVSVYRKPIVAIIPTGSELLPIDTELTPGKIRNSNGYMLAVQVAKAGGIPQLMKPVQDDVEKLREALEHALEVADVVITTGGVSVGDHDILVDWFKAWDGELLFNKIMMRPGSPTSVGCRNGQFIFALSGNPGASFVGFELFVRPTLLYMQGVTDVNPTTIEAELQENFDKPNAYTRYVRGRLSAQEGKLTVRLAGIEQSSVVRTIAAANCLMIVPPGAGVTMGEMVRVIPLSGWGRA